jgi:hypothetical protein
MAGGTYVPGMPGRVEGRITGPAEAAGGARGAEGLGSGREESGREERGPAAPGASGAEGAAMIAGPAAAAGDDAG